MHVQNQSKQVHHIFEWTDLEKGRQLRQQYWPSQSHHSYAHRLWSQCGLAIEEESESVLAGQIALVGVPMTQSRASTNDW
eukprot:m.22500 g.22500  ORF g.22500 m.22500 type:complete len:80 (+) comp10756_c0_seq1:99-338(+)